MPVSNVEAVKGAHIPDSRDAPISTSYGDRARWFVRARRERYLTMLRNGVQPMRAARACRVSYRQVINHRNMDPWFAQAEKDAKMEAIEEVVEAVFVAAVSGNVRAGIFILTNRLPDEWKESKAMPVIPNTSSGGAAGPGRAEVPVPVPIEVLRAEVRAQAEAVEAHCRQLVHPLARETTTVTDAASGNPFD